MTAARALRPPANDSVRRQMRAQRERDTGTEQALRAALHKRGLRFRLHRRLLKGLRREVDIVFVSARVAVFVDGCFWHGCPEHGSWPKNNGTFWKQKIEANRKRDAETTAQLKELGWKVIRVWEHEDPRRASERIAQLVRKRSSVT